MTFIRENPNIVTTLPVGTGGVSSIEDYFTAVAIQAVIMTLTDGRDGDCDLDGTNEVPFATRSGSTYTAFRVPLPRNLIVRAGVTLKMAQFAGPWCQGDMQVDGTISADGLDASGATAGAATAAGTFPPTIAGGAGGAAGADNNGAQGGNSTLEAPSAGRWRAGRQRSRRHRRRERHR